MLKVAKFGGSSLADAAGFMRVRDIVRADPARRVVVLSAAGKRHPSDHKLTDLLYLCHAHLQYGVSCHALWRRICDRYLAIRDALGLHTPLEEEMESLYASFSPAVGRDFLASRGEYFSARLMADYLGFSFVDAKDWLRFDYSGAVLEEESYALLAEAADGRCIVTPGFYGALPDGTIHTFSRGGSDVTGALAAAALHADLYENWTDVPGILAADPRIAENPAPIPLMSYHQMELLSGVGTQVLHESAVAPVRQAGIPLQIRSTLEPEKAGTMICSQSAQGSEPDVLAFAGRRKLAMFCLSGQGVDLETVSEALRRAGVSVFADCRTPGQLTCLVESGDVRTLRAAAETLSSQAEKFSMKEDLCVLAVLHTEEARLSIILRALTAAEIPVFHVLRQPPLTLLLVPDERYEAALRAAYTAQ